MSKLHKDIIKKSGCNVLDCSKGTLQSIKSDLVRRLAQQEKDLIKAQGKGWNTSIIESGIEKIKRTLEVVSE